MAIEAHSPPSQLATQLQTQRRSVDFDSFDITVREILSMLKAGAIDIAPPYQRKFRWDATRCSQLVESLFLGIPVPTIFMAANADGTWELVDGVQRLSTLAKFAGDAEVRRKAGVGEPLSLVGLEKLSNFQGYDFENLPTTMQLQFNLRPVKVVTLNDKSDREVRFDLFERLNTGGIELTDQEIRDCVYRGQFSDFLERLASSPTFKKLLKLTEKQEKNATREECVLRFFAFLNRYKFFVHSVKDFLNDYMKDASKSFEYSKGEKIFEDTFGQLAAVLPGGIGRPHRKGTTSLILYEGVAVGAALAMQKAGKLRGNGVRQWLGSPELRKHTTGATNNPAAVKGRIEFCRDRFLGK